MHLRSTTHVIISTILATMFAAGTAVTALAADYYVSPSGSDGNSGAQAAPWKTLQKAANSVSAGDVVHVGDGFYVGFQVTRDGTAANPITFVADGSNVVVNAQNTSTPDNINIEGGDYVVIDGFIVEDAPRVGIRAVLATGVIIRNNDVRRSGLTGILSGWTPSIQIINNTSSSAIDQHGIYVSNSNVPDDNPIIRGNECFGNNKNGIQINGDCWEGGDGVIQGALIEDNFVHDNYWKGISLISMQNSVVQNNVIYENGLSSGAGGIHLADQVGPSCDLPSSNNVIVNNTVVEPRIACIRFTDGSTSNVVFNNLCVAPSTSRLIADEVGGNLIDAGSNLTVTSSAGLFANEAQRDYHLAGGSAAIDAGVTSYQGQNAPQNDRDGGNRAGAGTTYDIGAYESGAGGGDPPPPPPGDTSPPALVITSPQDGAQINGSISVNCSATDNVGVAGVTFYVNGIQLGNEDTTAPYAITLPAASYSTGYYQLHCTARDAAGNGSASAVVTVFIQSTPDVDGIPASHPRLYNITNRLQTLRAKACRDASGNVIPGCTPTQDYTDWYDANPGAGRGEPWSYALMYLLTRDQRWADDAISQTIAEIDNGLGQKGAGERQDYFLNGHHYVRSTTIVYDWLYDLLTQAQRDKIVNYLNQLLYEIWNPRTNICKYSSGWGQGNPAINYYYRHVMAAALVGIATYGENDYTANLTDCDAGGGTVQVTFPLEDQVYTDPIEFVYGNIDRLIVPYIDNYEAGGGWREGTNYGRASKILMFEIFTILRDGGLRNLYEEIDFPRQSAIYHMYEMQPGNDYHYTNGDSPRDPKERPNDSDRHLMLLLIDGLPNHVESDYAQFWVDTYYAHMDERLKKAHGFLFYDPGHPARDYRQDLTNAYHAQGMNYVNSRSSWADDAVSVNFVSTGRTVGHCHKNQNEFAIYMNEWQTVNGNTYSVSGLIQDTQHHNTLTIAGEGQRFGSGTGVITKFEARAEFTYSVGDASDAYYTNPGGFGEGDEKMVQTFQRELVHVMPNTIIVFDRVTPTAAFQNSAITYNLNSLNQPSIQGNLVTCTNGGGRIFQRTLLPTNVTIKPVQSADKSFTWWRAEITPVNAVANQQFLNVIEAVPSSVQSMQATQVVNAANNTMVGVEIDDPSENKVIMFSTHPTGNAPQGDIIYQVSMQVESLHILLGLVAGAGYDVAVVEDEGRPAVVVSRGDTYACSDQGVLTFRLPASAPVLAGR